MKGDSISAKLHVVGGTLDDYKRLARYHYRDGRPGPVAAIFALKPAARSRLGLQTPTVGVIVYSMPVPEVELQDVATGGFFAGFDRSTKCALLNRHVRCITRLIVDPRFRGLGLASRLIRETMPRLDVSIVEAMAVMGLVNPFLERAGMTAYRAKVPVRSVRLIEALSSVGIEDRQLVDPAQAQRSIDQLDALRGQFIELEIGRFLKSYSRCRDMPAGLKRTRYVLSKLTARPVYYIWFNPGAPAAMAPRRPEDSFGRPGRHICHPEPFDIAQDRLREGPGSSRHPELALSHPEVPPCQPERSLCHPEPFDIAQDRLREGSGVRVSVEILRCAQNDTKRQGAQNDTKRQSAQNDTKRQGAQNDTKRQSAQNDTRGQGVQNDTRGQGVQNDTKRQSAQNDTSGMSVEILRGACPEHRPCRPEVPPCHPEHRPCHPERSEGSGVRLSVEILRGACPEQRRRAQNDTKRQDTRNDARGQGVQNDKMVSRPA